MNQGGGEAREARIRRVVEALCARECLGRAPGTPGSAVARERIVAELEQAGVEPGGEQGFEQRVPGCGTNVLARVPGAGALAERAVLVAAHYDHLGPAHGDQAFWGADDNAAAVAALLELARALVADPGAGPRRQVILAAFDGEEPPHFLSGTMGSMYYAAHPTVPLERIDTMVCMDLVGHAVGPPSFPPEVRQALFVLGAELSAGTAALVDTVAARARGVRAHRLGIDVVPPLSDYHAFQQARVPVLFLTCGRWEHYHTVEDTPEKLDYPKIAATAELLIDLTRALAARPELPVVFDPTGRDDLATIESLLAIGAAVAPLLPQVAVVRPVVEGLRERARRGPLPAAERQQLTLLVHALEDVLA